MRLLIDTNVFVEVLFNQRLAAEARTLLNQAKHEFHISIFALHSIGVIAMMRHRARLWPKFVKEMILSGHVKVLSLPLVKLPDISRIGQSFGLDFDSTPRGRKEPHEIN